MSITVYVLECASNKYYVGRTTNARIRLGDHVRGNGSAWTVMYRPLRVVHLEPNADPFDEDKFVKVYMRQYGIDNVRGGSYSQIKLDPRTRSALEKELLTVDDKCFGCRQAGHYLRDCPGQIPQRSGYLCEVCGEQAKTMAAFKRHDCTYVPDEDSDEDSDEGPDECSDEGPDECSDEGSDEDPDKCSDEDPDECSDEGPDECSDEGPAKGLDADPQSPDDDVENLDGVVHESVRTGRLAEDPGTRNDGDTRDDGDASDDMAPVVRDVPADQDPDVDGSDTETITGLDTSGGDLVLEAVKQNRQVRIKHRVAYVSGSESSEESSKCTRCGRNSHTVARCYARTHLNGSRL